MYCLRLTHSFSAAHQLTNAYDIKCNNSLHGHNFSVVVKLKTEQLIKGMVVDFTRIKKVINKLDHQNLNSILDFEATAENLAYYLFNEIENVVQQEGFLSVTIFEADKASIEYSSPLHT